MTTKDKNVDQDFSKFTNEDEWPGIDSRYRLIVVAALRSKQLQRGALPRLEADTRRRRNTSIALEEVKQGLVPFSLIDEERTGVGIEKTPVEAIIL